MPEPTPMKGLMFKKGDKRRNWSQRHFTLFNGALCYYASAETKAPKGFILTKDITACQSVTSDKVGKKSGKGEHAFEVVTKLRTYYLAPDSAEKKEEWIKAINTWIGYSEDVSTKELPEPGASQRQEEAKPAAAEEEKKDEAEAEAKTEDKPEETGDADTKPEESKPANEEAKAEEAAKEDESKPDEESKPAEEAAAAPAADATPAADDATPATDGDDAAAGDDKPEEEKQDIMKYESQYDYEAQEDNELSFKEGDIVTVLDTFKGAGWWKAELNGKIGLIPGNFFTKIE